MPKIIFDIETVGADMASLTPRRRSISLKYAKTDEEVQVVKDSTSFLSGHRPDRDHRDAGVRYGKGVRLIIRPRAAPQQKPIEGEAEYISAANEKQLLELFWSRIDKYDQFMTFNGRSFDCPFIMVRSAVNKIRASKNLMPDRYRSSAHIDLMEKLTFLGASRRKFSLHMWCTAFGIKSPKADGVSGLDVKKMFADGRYLDIARYCLGDVAATRELFHYWDKYINFPGS